MLKIETEKLPIFVWAEQSDLEGFDEAIEQAKNLATHPLARKHVALMPDFHIGYGMPIGGVLATVRGVVPNAVGVDIGCGMIAQKTSLEAASLDKETLQSIRQAIHARVPVGNGPSGNQKETRSLWSSAVSDYEYLPVIAANIPNASRQIGTLGGGNHFIELDKDEEGFVWVMLHSGSRNIGGQVCNYYDDIAKGGMPTIEPSGHVRMDKKQVKPFDRPDDLAFLLDSWPTYNEYMDSMRWCLRFAEANRERMLRETLLAISGVVGENFQNTGVTVQTHHNYAEMETHMGEELLVHRKGAVKAEGLVIIPGSMGTASYIGEGLGYPTSFRTCSHGAGRMLGRKEANRTIKHEDAVKSMGDVVFGVRQGDYEEMPAAYKDIDRVMENQRELVAPLHRLTPLAVVKG